MRSKITPHKAERNTMSRKENLQQGNNGTSQGTAGWPNGPYMQNNMQGGAAGNWQPHTGYTTPQVPISQGGYAQGQAPQQYSAVPPGAGNNPYGPGAGYGLNQPNVNAGSFIPQTPYSPGYTSPGYQPMQGYPPKQQGAQGGQAAQPAWPQAQQPQGYPQAQPYAGAQQSYTAPQQAAPWPQGQQAWQQQPQGYPYQPYSGGYNPYSQMGRAPQQGGQQEHEPQIPLNGGGYVPQRVSVRKRPFEMKDLYLVIAGALMIALFAAAVIITKNTALKILTIILAAGSAAVLWVKPMTAENKRLTYTIIALALCVLTAVRFLMKPAADTTNKTGGQPAAETGTMNTGTTAQANQPAATEQTQSAQMSEEEAENEATGYMIGRLYSFFNYWNLNRQDEMLLLCSPSWTDKQENPRTSLFILLGNRRPLDCTAESATGTSADSSRKVTVTSKIDRNDGREQELYRMTVLMVKENNEWYIDPQSLKSYEQAEQVTKDPNLTEAPTFTPEPPVYPTTVLYYNPNGGEYYHSDPECRNVGSKNRPLQGQFTYAEINDEPYAKLKPCNVCGAPLRP